MRSTGAGKGTMPSSRITIIAAVAVSTGLALNAGLASNAQAKPQRSGGGVPTLDVKTSCTDAQKFSSDNGKSAFKGCMQDETIARDELSKRWTSFKPKDRQDCVEQARTPSPSYVEVLTCLEMNTDAIGNSSKGGGKPIPQIGGPVAPGLPNAAPKT